MIQNAIIHGPVNPADYHAPQGVGRDHPAFVMSQSSLRAFALNPDAWRRGDEPKDEEESKAMRWGSALDCAVTQRERFAELYPVAPATYPVKNGEKAWNRNAAYCKKWEKERTDGGSTVMKKKERDMVLKARDILFQNRDIAYALRSNDNYQVKGTAEWHDPVTGIVIPLRFLADKLELHGDKKYYLDLKTTQNSLFDLPLSPRDLTPAMKWYYHCRKWGYDIQGGLTEDICLAAGHRLDSILHAVEGSKWPFPVATWYMSDQQISEGREKYESALKLRAQCLKTKQWPGATKGWEEIKTPQQKGNYEL